MPVVGKNCTVLCETGRTVDINVYLPDYPVRQVPVVDAAIRYDDPYDGVIRYFIIRNALHVPSMDNNLIPPFVMREAGIAVNDTPKIHVLDPGVDDHSLYFAEFKYRIPLSLHGIFSYFPSSKPSIAELNDSEEVNIYVLTPDQWNPHDTTFSLNEEAMLDWDGEMIPHHERK